MANLWHAECIPCGWVETYTEEDSAIRAAEDHASSEHPHVTSKERTSKYMGHVQMRDTSAAPLSILPVADEPERQGRVAILPKKPCSKVQAVPKKTE